MKFFQGENAQIAFRIFDGPDARLFELESDAKNWGEVRIRSRAQFDFESAANKFHFELQASRFASFFLLNLLNCPSKLLLNDGFI